MKVDIIIIRILIFVCTWRVSPKPFTYDNICSHYCTMFSFELFVRGNHIYKDAYMYISDVTIIILAS